MIVVSAKKIENKTLLTVVPHICGICQKAFLQERALLDHFIIHDVEKSEPIIKKSIKNITPTKDTNEDVEKLKITHIKKLKIIDNLECETNGANKTHCEICKRSFSSKHYLYKHLKLHKGDRSYKCDVCDKSFVLKDNLVKHAATHDPDKKRYLCLECGKSFTSRQYKEKHELIHLGEKPHICHVCQKAFTLKTNLNKHILIHSEERLRFSCNECGKGFSSKAYLEKHSMIHLGIKPHICSKCNKGFTMKTNLHKHFLIHTEKRFDCEICNRKFKSKITLEKHVLLHSSDQMYQCLLCSVVVSKCSEMEKHMQSHNYLSDYKTNFGDKVPFNEDCVILNEIVIESET